MYLSAESQRNQRSSLQPRKSLLNDIKFASLTSNRFEKLAISHFKMLEILGTRNFLWNAFYGIQQINN